MSAIKSILKENNFNKQHLASQLELITNKILDKGIFVVEKNLHGFYNIKEYTKNKVLLVDVPGYKLANVICNSLNSARRRYVETNLKIIQMLINRYHKLDNDCMYYRYTINTTADEFKKDIVITRLDVAVQQLKHVRIELSKLS